jgi:hypothetical protein
MRAFLACFLAAGFAAEHTVAADRVDQLFAAWQIAQRDVKSLVVEFTREELDPISHERPKANGTFRLIRTPKGEVFASYELRWIKGSRPPDRLSGILNNGRVYLLDHQAKSADRFVPSDGDLQRFLEWHFNPFIRLLDRNRVEEECLLELAKRDQWYTYVDLKPKHVKGKGSSAETFTRGRIVLMNEASAEIPKDMPRQLWYSDLTREYTFEIKSWRFNADAAPKLEEFTKPEDRPGWSVEDWPFGGKFLRK